MHRQTYGEFGLHTHDWLCWAWSGGLYWLGRTLGITADVVPAPEQVYWWTIPILLLSAAENALVEEIIEGVEESEGADWTSHENEVAFLEAVDEASQRVEMDVIGKYLQRSLALRGAP